MHEVEVDVEERGAFLPLGRPHLVRLPDLVEHASSASYHDLRRPAATTDRKRASPAARVLEVVGQVGVERDRVALLELVRAPVADEAQPSRRDDGGLAAARLVDRRVVRPACRRAGRERVQRHLGALAGYGRASAPRSGARGRGRRAAARRRARRVTPSPSSSRSSWDSESSSPAAIRPATASVGLVSPRSTCDSIGAETPDRSARSRSDRLHASRSARIRAPTAAGCVATAVTALVRYHIHVCQHRWRHSLQRPSERPLEQLAQLRLVRRARACCRAPGAPGAPRDDRRQRSSARRPARESRVTPASAASFATAVAAWPRPPLLRAPPTRRHGDRARRPALHHATKCGSMTALVSACGVPATRTIVWQTAWWTAKPATPLA